jgi:transcription antitermination factor NusG
VVKVSLRRYSFNRPDFAILHEKKDEHFAAKSRSFAALRMTIQKSVAFQGLTDFHHGILGGFENMQADTQTLTQPESSLLWEWPGSSEPQWYATYTVAHHEKSVAYQMQSYGIDHFLPLYRSIHRWKDRRKEVELPLFPSYVFVHLPLKDRMQVLRMPGVVHLVGFSGRPAPLPAAEIDALRSGLERNLLLEPYPYLKVGRRVRVFRGPLAGTEGILVRKKEKFRVVLSLDLIARSVAAEVDGGDIEPVRV